MMQISQDEMDKAIVEDCAEALRLWRVAGHPDYRFWALIMGLQGAWPSGITALINSKP